MEMATKNINGKDMSDSPQILIVEDSKFFASMLQRRITEDLGFSVTLCATYAEAVAAIDCCQDEYLAALLDLTLPDAPNGEIVEYAMTKNIPSIIFTGGFDGKMRSRFLSWNIVDYILKDSNSSMDAVLDSLRRIQKNQHIETLVVDDSKAVREAVCRLLRAQLYHVHEATNGLEGLEMLKKHPEIKLIVSDYDMPKMDGLEFIRKVRANHSKNELAIIGMSASDDSLLSAKLIKNGANDFVPKPFQVEEFHCRVGHSIEMLENIALIRDLSYKDPLTRLYNRRYFFENAGTFIKRCERDDYAYSVAMLDIDFFKKVNDTYGHDGGDEVLKEVSTIVMDAFGEDAITCRFGGEEFCVLLCHGKGVDVVPLFDGLRQTIEDASVTLSDDVIKVTISTGVCSEPDSVEAMLKIADSRLYTAKETGRNRVVGVQPNPNVRA